MNYVYYDYICACTIDVAARTGVYCMHIHIDLSIYTGICNRMYMHACMQGTRSCMRALRNVNRARPLISTAGDARVHRKSHLYMYIYIYIYTYRNIYVRACTHAYRCCTHARPPQLTWFENPAANSNSTLPAAPAAAMPSAVYYGPLIYIYI